jgi:hypothetical protein
VQLLVLSFDINENCEWQTSLLLNDAGSLVADRFPNHGQDLVVHFTCTRVREDFYYQAQYT